MAMNDRYHSDFSRQDRFHDFDHRDRGRYQEHSIDRLVSSLHCCLKTKHKNMYLMSHFAAFTVCLVRILFFKCCLVAVDFLFQNHENICTMP